MATSVACSGPGFTVRVEIEARAAAGLESDAEIGAQAVIEWLKVQANAGTFNDYRNIYGSLTGHELREMRELYRAAMEGETDVDPMKTEYGKLIGAAEGIAHAAATAGWHNPDGANVWVQIEPACVA